MVCEISVIVKDDEKSLTIKYLIYDRVWMDEEDPIIKDCIEKALINFEGDPIDITVKAKLEIQ
jgi:hypothetical protein